MIHKLKLHLKKAFFILLLVFSLTCFSACTTKDQSIENVVAIGYLGNDIYLLSNDNNSLLLEGYDLIEESIDEYMYIRKNGLYGYINIKGKEIIKPSFTKAFSMNENKAVVIKDGLYHIIDLSGNIIYTLPNNVTSTSYFSENRLVVERDGMYGYLIYDEESSTFILPGEFPYSRALPFSEGYGVVATEQTVDEKTSVKYNFLSKEGHLLFETYCFDEAESFHEGLAKVATFTKSVRVESVGTGNEVKPPRYYDMNVYSYIDKEGNYLIDSSTGNKLECLYGTNICDGVITTAIFKYYLNDSIVDNLFRDYTFYTKDGDIIYDDCFTYTSHENINIFWPTNTVELGNNHIFGVGKQSVSWNIVLANKDSLEFKNINYKIDSNEKWIKDLADLYYTSTAFIESNVKYPYHMSDFKKPVFANNTLPLTVVQVSFNDNGKYGILQLNYDESILESETNIAKAYFVSYIVPPIYDRIVL